MTSLSEIHQAVEHQVKDITAISPASEFSESGALALSCLEPDVAAYLDSHPLLPQLITQLYLRVRQFFGGAATMRLELMTFPDTGYQRLYGLVQVSDEPEAASERLYRFQEEWWLEALHNAEGGMTIALEYV